MPLKVQRIDYVDLVAQADYGTCGMQEVSEDSGKLLKSAGQLPYQWVLPEKKKKKKLPWNDV